MTGDMLRSTDPAKCPKCGWGVPVLIRDDGPPRDLRCACQQCGTDCMAPRVVTREEVRDGE